MATLMCAAAPWATVGGCESMALTDWESTPPGWLPVGVLAAHGAVGRLAMTTGSVARAANVRTLQADLITSQVPSFTAAVLTSAFRSCPYVTTTVAAAGTQWHGVFAGRGPAERAVHA